MNCFLSGAIVRTGGSQPCIGGAPSVKYAMWKEFTPIEVSKELKVTNKTVINL